ncbi:hypothetical protein L3Q82_009588, partial [Scortum barcoo]
NPAADGKAEVTCCLGLHTISPPVGHNCSGFQPARQFVQNFHVSRESFDYICGRVGRPCHEEKEHDLIYACVSQSASRWQLSSGSWPQAASTGPSVILLALSTVFNRVQDFCNAVIMVLFHAHIAFPDTDKLVGMATFFENRWGVPQCVGAIDGCHIPIIAPEQYARDYYNRKGCRFSCSTSGCGRQRSLLGCLVEGNKI